MKVRALFHSLLRFFLDRDEVAVELSDREELTLRQLIEELSSQVGRDLAGKLLREEGEEGGLPAADRSPPSF